MTAIVGVCTLLGHDEEAAAAALVVVTVVLTTAPAHAGLRVNINVAAMKSRSP